MTMYMEVRMLRMMITMMMVMMRPLSQRVNPSLRTLVYGSGTS